MTNGPIARDARLGFGRWLLAHAVVLTLLWASGVVLFLVVAGRIDNDFAEAARRDHVGSIVRVHLVVLPAYVLVALVGSLLTFPIERRLVARRIRRGKSGRRRIPALVLRALLWQAALFVLSFGWVTATGSISLDVVARTLSSTLPGIDPYVFFDWKLREVFLGVMLVWVVFAVLDLARGALAATARSPMYVRAGVGLIGGAGVGLLLLAGSHDEPAAPIQAPLPNVVIIASDSLRYDHLSCHGYERPTSPNIDALVPESIDFEQMTVATASTLESWGTFLTGRWPANHGLRYMFIAKEEADAIARDQDTLPRALDRLGYDTVAVGDWAANCFSLVDFGFEETETSDVQNLDVFLFEVAYRTHVLVPHYFGNALGEALMPMMNQVTSYVNPEALTGRFLDRFDASAAAGRPFFGVLFMSCTHLPYASPHPWNVRFGDPDYRGPNTYQIAFDVDDFIQHGFPESVPAAEKQRVIDLYDGGVAWFDDNVGKVMAHLRERGLDRNTIVIVTSDHGDDLYEPNTTLGHGTNFFGGDQSTRIPFLMRLPGGQKGGRSVPGITRNVDVMPTILDLVTAAGGELEEPLVDPARQDGVSLVPYVTGATDDLGLAAFAETCYLFYPKRMPGEDVYAMAPADRTLEIDPDFRNLFVLKDEYHDYVIDTKDRMMRTDRWKLVYVKGRRGPIWRFYDMATDPQQLHDLAPLDLSWTPFEQMKTALLRWIETGDDVLWPRELDLPR